MLGPSPRETHQTLTCPKDLQIKGDHLLGLLKIGPTVGKAKGFRFGRFALKWSEEHGNLEWGLLKIKQEGLRWFWSMFPVF